MAGETNVYGTTAAVMVAMINSTEGFDIRNEQDRKAVQEAIVETFETVANSAPAKAYQQRLRDQYAE